MLSLFVFNEFAIVMVSHRSMWSLRRYLCHILFWPSLWSSFACVVVDEPVWKWEGGVCPLPSPAIEAAMCGRFKLVPGSLDPLKNYGPFGLFIRDLMAIREQAFMATWCMTLKALDEAIMGFMPWKFVTDLRGWISSLLREKEEEIIEW